MNNDDLDPPDPVDGLRERWVRIQERITDAGGDPGRVRLLAVTKGQPTSVALAAVELGLTDLGESYAQELVAKADDLQDQLDRIELTDNGPPRPRRPEARWHFIGTVQRNKVRLVAPHVHLWQSVDRLAVAAEIGRHAPGAAVLVQVNVSGSDQQGGCPPERVAAMVEGCTDLGLEVRGLMAIGARAPGDAPRAGFRVVSGLADRLGLAERSMGMSGDLEAAVAEGATMIRVGTALFGPRGQRPVVGK